MKQETKEAIKKVLLNMPVVPSYGPLSAWHDKEVGGVDEALTAIIAAVERERVGEVVVAQGQFSTTDDWELFVSPRDGSTCNCEFTRLDGKRCELIFRPTKEAK